MHRVRVILTHYAALAQLADAVGSNPTFYRFESYTQQMVIAPSKKANGYIMVVRLSEDPRL